MRWPWELQLALGLDHDQIEEIKRIKLEYGRQTRSAANLPRPKMDSIQNKSETASKIAQEKMISVAQTNMAKVRVETMKSIEKILTNPQRKAYLIKTGPSFDFFGAKGEEKQQPKKVDREGQSGRASAHLNVSAKGFLAWDPCNKGEIPAS